MSTIRANTIVDSAGGNTATINGITPALASQAQAEAGTNNTTLMTPLRAAQNLQANNINFGTSVATTSGTAFDFTGIPSWVGRITVVIDGVSLSGTDDILVQLGTSGGVVSTGYASSCSFISTGVATLASSAGFIVLCDPATEFQRGVMSITRLSGSSNTWVASYAGSARAGGTPASNAAGGAVALGGVLDRVRITRAAADTFDAGNVNITWE